MTARSNCYMTDSLGQVVITSQFPISIRNILIYNMSNQNHRLYIFYPKTSVSISLSLRLPFPSLGIMKTCDLHCPILALFVLFSLFASFSSLKVFHFCIFFFFLSLHQFLSSLFLFFFAVPNFLLLVQIGETCNGGSTCDAGLSCQTCPANGNTRPRCTRIQPVNAPSKVLNGFPVWLLRKSERRINWITFFGCVDFD